MTTEPQIDSSQVLNALAGAAKRHRPLDVIQEDLDEAKAEHRKLMPLVESERHKEARQKERIQRAELKWKVENPDDPFDADAFSPPLRPYKPDQDLYRRFHAIHYTIADRERELADAQKARALGVSSNE